LIIFAATVLAFVDNERFSAEDQLAQILKQKSTYGTEDEYQPIDELYLSVLETAARRTRNDTHATPALCDRLRVLTGTIVLLQNPLSIPALAQLTGIREVDVANDVNALSAILLLGPDKDDCGDPIVRIFHPSFRDFLLERCSDCRFSVNFTQQHRVMSVYCLRLLNQHLKYDICDIKDPTIPHVKVTNPPLAQRLQQHIHQAVQYACQFWINHSTLSDIPDSDLLMNLQEFVSNHILHWVEGLSLISKLHYAMQHLADAVSWSQVSNSMIPPDTAPS
jgi:hypothetical protein